MNKIIIRPQFFFVLCFIFSFSTLAIAGSRHLYRPMAQTIEKKGYEFEFDTSYFATSSVVDSEGAESSLDGSSFTKWDSQAELRYGYGDQLEMRGGFRYRQNESSVASLTETVSTTKAGLESYWAGVRYAFKSTGKTKYSLDLRYRQTAYSNTEFASTTTIPTDDLVLGDDGTEVRLGMYMSYLRTPGNTLSAYAAYNRPPNELSDEIVYKFDSMMAGDNWGLGVGLDGVYSLNKDEFSSSPSLKPQEQTGATGMFNSINRSYSRAYGGIYYAFKRWRLGLTAAQIFQAESYDKGTEFGLNILIASKGTSKNQVMMKKFKEYSIEASVIKVSPRGSFIRIDAGLSGDVEKGMKFDIYQTDFFGGNVLVASGIVYEVGADKSIVKIVRKYKKVSIKKGFAARGYQ